VKNRKKSGGQWQRGFRVRGTCKLFFAQTSGTGEENARAI